MTRFRCVPVATEVAERFRRTVRDDRGQALRRRVVETPGSPCRCCLQPAQPGDAMLLGSHDLPRPQGMYWMPSPIFLHERECQRFEATDEIAPTVLRYNLVSVRSYDAEELCLYDLGEVCEGAAVEPALRRALEDSRTRHINIHTARPGCWLCAVERV